MSMPACGFCAAAFRCRAGPPRGTRFPRSPTRWSDAASGRASRQSRRTRRLPAGRPRRPDILIDSRDPDCPETMTYAGSRPGRQSVDALACHEFLSRPAPPGRAVRRRRAAQRVEPALRIGGSHAIGLPPARFYGRKHQPGRGLSGASRRRRPHDTTSGARNDPPRVISMARARTGSVNAQFARRNRVGHEPFVMRTCIVSDIRKTWRRQTGSAARSADTPDCAVRRAANWQSSHTAPSWPGIAASGDALRGVGAATPISPVAAA